jgi:hypothetical protein
MRRILHARDRKGSGPVDELKKARDFLAETRGAQL